MRCKACDKLLTEYEATRKSIVTNEFLDLCNTCYNYIKDDVYTIDNQENINIHDVVECEDDLTHF